MAHPTIIANAACQDNQNVPSSSNKNLEKQIASNDKNQIYQHPDLQYIIIDMAPVTFIDSSGSNMLEKVRIHARHYNNYVSGPTKTSRICTNNTCSEKGCFLVSGYDIHKQVL